MVKSVEVVWADNNSHTNYKCDYVGKSCEANYITLVNGPTVTTINLAQTKHVIVTDGEE